MNLKNVNHQKRSFTWSMEKPSAKDYFLTVFIFVVCTLIGLLFQKLNFTDTNIVTIYIPVSYTHLTLPTNDRV